MCWLGLSITEVSRRGTRSGKLASAQASRSILLCGWLFATLTPSMTHICHLHPPNAAKRVRVSFVRVLAGVEALTVRPETLVASSWA